MRFLQTWVRSYPYNKYRNFPDISEEQAQRVLMDTITQQGPTIHNFWIGDEHSLSGMIRVTDLGWDEIVYNMKIGNLTHVCGEVPLSGIRDRLTQAGYDHIVTRADSSDFTLQCQLIREGFFLVDSILTYVYPRLSDPITNKHCPEPRLPFVFRDYEPGDREAVLAITQQMYARYPSRYYRDPVLRERSTRRYLMWIEKYLDGEADKILVAELNGKPTAFMAYRYDRQLFQSTGIVSYGSGLGASTLEGGGCILQGVIQWD